MTVRVWALGARCSAAATGGGSELPLHTLKEHTGEARRPAGLRTHADVHGIAVCSIAA